MKRIVTVYGLIAGAIVSLLMTLNMSLMRQEHGATAMVIGYATMLLAFCLIFIGIKSYRDKHLGGRITFGRAFLTGLWIALIASVCYTITWAILYKNFYPDFLDNYNRSELARLVKSGKSPAQTASAKKEMDAMAAMYATWPGLIGFTLLEILPVGLLVSLIAALVLKRKEKAAVPAPQYT